MNQRRAAGLLAIAAVGAFSSIGAAQTVVDTQDFEGATFGGWLVNGNEEIFGDGNPGFFMGLPYGAYQGVQLRNENTESPVVGDLTVYPSLEISVDFRVFQLRNWFDEDMPPEWFDLTLEFVDYDPYASVYITGPVLPSIADGWTTFTFTVPDTSQTALPPGWGGTGDEDPNTFEPRLPANRTYTDVLANVDEIRISTMKPGWAFVSSWWQAGFDNVRVVIPGTGPECGTSDFNGDGASGLDDDIEAFFLCLGGNCCATCWHNGADFNGDGAAGLDDDIEAFFIVLGGGTC